MARLRKGYEGLEKARSRASLNIEEVDLRANATVCLESEIVRKCRGHAEPAEAYQVFEGYLGRCTRCGEEFADDPPRLLLDGAALGTANDGCSRDSGARPGMRRIFTRQEDGEGRRRAR